MRRLVLLLAVVTALTLPSVPHSRADAPDFSAFVGTWQHHGSLTTIDTSGLVTTTGTGGFSSPPTITAHLVAVVDNTAYGTTDATGDSVWLVLLPYDMLLYEDTRMQVGTVLCGPDATFFYPGTFTLLPGMTPLPCGA